MSRRAHRLRKRTRNKEAKDRAPMRATAHSGRRGQFRGRSRSFWGGRKAAPAAMEEAGGDAHLSGFWLEVHGFTVHLPAAVGLLNPWLSVEDETEVDALTDDRLEGVWQFHLETWTACDVESIQDLFCASNIWEVNKHIKFK